jgi:hypothetical protein
MLAFAALVVYIPPLQHVFGTASLGPEVLAVFPVIVLGSDELHRWWRRRRTAAKP